MRRKQRKEGMEMSREREVARAQKRKRGRERGRERYLTKPCPFLLSFYNSDTCYFVTYHSNGQNGGHTQEPLYLRM